jgi:hypothetical protein
MDETKERTDSATPAHLAAMKWLSDNPDAFADYDEGWVAVVDGRVLAHGESVGDVIRAAELQGYGDPLLVPIMPYPFIGS